MLARRAAALRKAIVSAELALAGALLVVLFVSLLGQVFFRYVLSHPLSWSEELARFMFVWVSLLGGSAYVSGAGGHGIDLLVNKLPESVRNVIADLVRLAMFIFSLSLVAKGYELTQIVHNQWSPVLGLRMSYVYVSVCVAGLSIALTLLLEQIERFAGGTDAGQQQGVQ